MSGHHLAAILSKPGADFQVEKRLTPTPGPGELLIEVKSAAINPLDFIQRAFGFHIEHWPAVLGSDIGGVVLSAGPNCRPEAPKPGDRVTSLADCYYKFGHPNYGAFQEKVIVPAEYAAKLPDNLTFNEAALMPMAVETTFAGLYSIGIPFSTSYTPADKKGLLVWGGASSLGTACIQIVKSMGYTVYATASAKHHEFLKKLGASRVFDYKTDDVVQRIVTAGKEDGLTFQECYCAIGELTDCQKTLLGLKGPGHAKVASAPPLKPEFQAMADVEVKFVLAPEGEQQRLDHFHFVFHKWLTEKLAKGEFVPTPGIRVVPGGLKSANAALDEWKKGVSAEKIIIEL